MDPINIYDAKTRLSQLVDQAVAGHDVVISRHGKPLVRLTALSQPVKKAIPFGLLKGQLTVPRDFDAPLPEAILHQFQGP